MGTRITIENLVKVFGSGSTAATAVDDLSLTIEPGELFFLLGPSGCGKTTLLRMIAGFIDPTKGTIAFDGNDVTHAPPNKRNTGMVFQSYALWPHMTVAQNVAFGLNVRKVPNPEKDQRVIEALTAVQMEKYAQRKPNQLSGGQQQRVALARALVIKPDVLLLDEPLSNLDAKLRNDLRLQIRKICKDSGITTVYVTHDQKEALSMADRVALLRDGQIMQIGTPRELYRAPKTRFVAEFLGETNLIEAKPSEVTPDRVQFEVEAGSFNATPQANMEYLSNGEQNLLSIRPEAIRLRRPEDGNTLPGKLLETTYLGETAQHLVEIKGCPPIKIAEMNPYSPSSAVHPEPGDSVWVEFQPGDIVPVDRR
ncbi:MAG TPA: spermidine/putrescine ABC transporter ATP-binding protein [Phycisphaerales bacterium]|nr:spermidine/putrescine ABC transporter ATP-binding protein [Phycisphaerae bacterium]HCT46649.1 spermidine/putrescine ABC transporter ATP-binding protein [Phycisphaerales bacterium]